ncbi:MAG: hypothetical protein Q4C89_00925 [Deinococcus sp.]|uniref:hypothetical protein n=1 Tax=Deinococcus sp. TaxID=47478 RepID=UPI0026DD718D|nr:hypothetical protein [Deinococcus sp.]MDO4244572.1 hypothetical protein [Deinococcus sp.]
MKKSLMLTALLIGSAAAFAPRGEKLAMGIPHWVADYHSLDLHGAGAPMDWTAWTNPKYGTPGRREIPTGTAISLSDAGKIVPADGTRRTLLLISNAKEWLPSDSISGYGLVVRGNIYEDQLPDAVGGKLPETIRAQARDFYWQSLGGVVGAGGSGPSTEPVPVVLTSGDVVTLTAEPYQVFSINVGVGAGAMEIESDILPTDGTMTVTTSDGVVHSVGTEGGSSLTFTLMSPPAGTMLIAFRGSGDGVPWAGKRFEVVVE